MNTGFQYFLQLRKKFCRCNDSYGVLTATYINLAVTLTLSEPDGCEFLLADEDLRPNDITWNFSVAGDKTNSNQENH